MNSSRGKTLQEGRYLTDISRWQAVAERDANADESFFFAVRTTGVYCYASCPARRPRRSNVCYYVTRDDAESAGYRPCQRCRSHLAPPAQRQADVVARACQALMAEDPPGLTELAADAGLSPHYLHRLFKRATGLTPKQYARGQRDARMRRLLADADSVTEAIYAAGYGSDSRFYERAGEVLGMGARAYGRGGIDVAVRYCVAECWLGQVLVAATSVGVCAIFLSDQGVDDQGVDDQGADLRRDLQQRFPAATLEAADEGSDFTAWVSAVVAFVEAPHGDFPLPLDIAGTAFQERVWSALREIPCGSTASYKEIAAAIGQPTATRAVAGACAANPVAVAVPCHRVVRGDGKLSGYRWGVARKRALLDRERELADPAGSKPRSKN